MTQQELEQQIAASTGEDLRLIRLFGFQLEQDCDPLNLDDLESQGQILDWDQGIPVLLSAFFGVI